MTDFKSHADTGFKATKAYVVPEKKDETAFAKKVVFETEGMGEVTCKPRYEEEEEKKLNGVPVKDTVKKMYPISRLPEKVKNRIFEVNDSDDGVTFSATVGEAINNGNSSYFISWDNWDTIDKKQTVLGDEQETAEEMAEIEVEQ